MLFRPETEAQGQKAVEREYAGDNRQDLKGSVSSGDVGTY